MTLPKQWSEVKADAHNKSLSVQSAAWEEDPAMVFELPVAYQDILLVIDNQTDKTLTGTLQQHIRTDKARATAVVSCVDEDGEGEGVAETITITNADPGEGAGIPAFVEIFVNPEAGEELSVVANINERGIDVITITLGTDAEGQPDPLKNTAAAIVALINGSGEGEGEVEGIGVATAEYSGAGTGYVDITLGEDEDREIVMFANPYVERWASVYDSEGVELELTVATTERKVFGPFTHWPRFLGGLLMLTPSEPPTEGGLVTVQLQGV